MKILTSDLVYTNHDKIRELSIEEQILFISKPFFTSLYFMLSI